MIKIDSPLIEVICKILLGDNIDPRLTDVFITNQKTVLDTYNKTASAILHNNLRLSNRQYLNLLLYRSVHGDFFNYEIVQELISNYKTITSSRTVSEEKLLILFISKYLDKLTKSNVYDIINFLDYDSLLDITKHQEELVSTLESIIIFSDLDVKEKYGDLEYEFSKKYIEPQLPFKNPLLNYRILKITTLYYSHARQNLSEVLDNLKKKVLSK
jgi:hypothetical protein